MSWTDLQKRFKNIVITAGGPSKSSSGNLEVTHHFNGDISVCIDAYDIVHWSRHTEIGTFTNETDAMQAVSNKLDEAEELVYLKISNCCLYCKNKLNFEGYCRTC